MSIERLEFRVKGVPIPQGSKRNYGVGRMVEANPELMPWRDLVRAEAERTAFEVGWTTAEGPVMVGLSFTLIRPKSVRRLFPTVKPDLDKLTRAVNDALTIARVVHDDALIISSAQSKRYASDTNKVPGVYVVVSRMHQDEFELAG